MCHGASLIRLISLTRLLDVIPSLHCCSSPVANRVGLTVSPVKRVSWNHVRWHGTALMKVQSRPGNESCANGAGSNPHRNSSDKFYVDIPSEWSNEYVEQ